MIIENERPVFARRSDRAVAGLKHASDDCLQGHLVLAVCLGCRSLNKQKQGG
jgi:hypothetical protein